MDRQDHESLALWAADCAEHVLPHFEEERPGDERPRRAIEAGRAWAQGGIKISEARATALAAHAAAREDARAEAQAAALLLRPPVEPDIKSDQEQRRSEAQEERKPVTALFVGLALISTPLSVKNSSRPGSTNDGSVVVNVQYQIHKLSLA